MNCNNKIQIRGNLQDITAYCELEQVHNNWYHQSTFIPENRIIRWENIEINKPITHSDVNYTIRKEGEFIAILITNKMFLH
jgi:hypothetical protein